MRDQDYFLSFFPQFCREPLNDAAWGDGFTDWQLITAMEASRQPEFTPQRGFYDPSSEDYVADLARRFAEPDMSRFGLMVYHYFFDGRHALQGFEQRLLARSSAVPFFLCWANETWTKRWVGQPGEIIVRQEHRLDRKVIALHAAYLARFFDRPEYRRHQGRPLFLIYDFHASSDMRRVLEVYREAFAALGHQPYIGGCFSYPCTGLAATGFDFACEFEPRFFFNSRRSTPLLRLVSRIKPRAPRLFDWLGGQRDKLRSRAAGAEFLFRDYLNRLEDVTFEKELRRSADGLALMRGLFYGWNNEPRYRHNRTFVTHHTDDEERYTLLAKVRSDLGLPVLVNSWNEWSEGAALEPPTRPDRGRDAFLASLSGRDG